MSTRASSAWVQPGYTWHSIETYRLGSILKPRLVQLSRNHEAFAAQQFGHRCRVCASIKERSPCRNLDCAVCGDECAIVDLPSLVSCAHKPEICTACYKQWISTQVYQGTWVEMPCPATGCKTTLTHHEVKNLATPKVFDRYDTFLTQAALDKDSKC